MSLADPAASFREALRRAASRSLGIEPEAIPVTHPPTTKLGDLASPLCFELARSLRRPPRELAAAIVGAFEPGGGIARVEVAGGGYVNGFLDRRTFLTGWLTGPGVSGDRPARGPKSIVEHTNINPNKAAHIGHLRNAVLGDTLVRCLRRLGRRVEVQNYIDDTGVQVADLVVGFQHLRGQDLAAVRREDAAATAAPDRVAFDHLAWDLYAEVTRFYEREPERGRELRRRVLHEMERGDNPTAELAGFVARRMVQHHLTTMGRLDVRYDLLPRESDILGLRFWDAARERLAASGAMELVTEGKNAGCLVMRLPGAEPGSGEDEKVIVRSDGTVTYVGKDIAYQLWKFGLLGRDFHYRRFDWSPLAECYTVWVTTSDASAAEDSAPAFGEGRVVYNVIDTRQSYLQRVVAAGLRSLGHAEQAERSIHYAYEMVALTPAAVAALFPDHPLSEEERGKAYLEMSGRRGLGVKADDLLDTMMARAVREVRARNQAMADDDVARTAERIVVGAVRYYMLRFTRNRVVAFDLDAALAFEGETGPYLQYSVVRARNILAKLVLTFGDRAVEPGWLAERLDLAALPAEAADEHWSLPLMLGRVDEVLAQAVESLELSGVAKHAYVVAQAFNSFYHRYPVAQESDERARATRTAIVRVYHERMIELLGLMGIEVPERM